MTTVLLRPHAVVLRDAVAYGLGVAVRNGRIFAVGEDLAHDGTTIPIDGTLLPGMIDLQVNGGAGHGCDTAATAEEPLLALDAIARAVFEGGASAFLPTLITAPLDALVTQLDTLAEWIEERASSLPPGMAEPLGIHLEGPFLATPGAHCAQHFVDPTEENIERLLAAARGHLRLVTMAPSRPGAPDAVARLRRNGVTVSLGHGDSTQGLHGCLEAGASMVTHLFNAMGRLHHREPGLAGHALDDRRLTASLIADGVHVDPIMLRLAFRCLGPDRSVLVSDCIAALGQPDGAFELAGQPVTLDRGVIRDAHGNLAGSALSMADAAQQFLRHVHTAGPWSVARMTATNPAALLDRTDRGVIAPGRRAQFTVLDDEGRFRVYQLP